MTHPLHRHSATKPSIAGFEHINRYFDPRRQAIVAKILPGEYYVTDEDEIITTTLGSCVSACIWDPVSRIGGMNHFMLPEATSSVSSKFAISHATKSARYGTYAMEHLINTIITHGGNRQRLVVKIAGGGAVLAGLSNIGARNIDFIHEYLALENFELISEHVGGNTPRKLFFQVTNGRARVKMLDTLDNDTIAKRETDYQRSIDKSTGKADVELF